MDSHILMNIDSTIFAILVVTSMASAGLCLGWITDRLLPNFALSTGEE